MNDNGLGLMLAGVLCGVAVSMAIEAGEYYLAALVALVFVALCAFGLWQVRKRKPARLPD